MMWASFVVESGWTRSSTASKNPSGLWLPLRPSGCARAPVMRAYLEKVKMPSRRERMKIEGP